MFIPSDLIKTPNFDNATPNTYSYTTATDTLDQVAAPFYFAGSDIRPSDVISVRSIDGEMTFTANGLTSMPSASEVAAAVNYASIDAISTIKSAANRRIDFVMIGDSNQHHSGSGFDRAISTYLGNKYGIYATGQYRAGGYTSKGVYGMIAQNYGGTEATPVGTEDNYINAYTVSTNSSPNGGVTLPANSALDTNSNIRFWFGYTGYESGGGSFQPKIRIEESSYSTLVTGSVVDVNVGNTELNLAYLDLAAGTRTYKIKGGMAVLTPIVAPMTYNFQRAENLDADTGISCDSYIGIGGASLLDLYDNVTIDSTAQISAYFNECRRLQIAKGYDPKIVIYINSGLNDRSEAVTPSRGIYAWTDDASNQKAYADNAIAFTKLFDDIWHSNGWDKNELSFLLIASHVVSDPNDAKLTLYRAALTEIAARNKRISTVDLSELMTYDEAAAGGWYINATTETEHLTSPAGYDAVAALIFSGLDIA